MITNIILQIDSKCNLQCSYCFSKGVYIQNKEKIVEGLRTVLKQYPNVSNITITGGEPTLNFEFIRSIRKLVNPKIGIGIISNGLLLNDKKLKNCIKEDIKIKISIDGLLSFEQKRLTPELLSKIEKYPAAFSGISKVITKKNYRNTYYDLKKFLELPLTEIDIIPEMYVHWKKNEIITIIHELKKIKVLIKKLRQKPKINITAESKERYLECNNIFILPDGDLSLCNSLTSFGKKSFIPLDKIKEYDTFKKAVIIHAIKKLQNKKLLQTIEPNTCCLVDSYYHYSLYGKDIKVLHSQCDLLSRIQKIGL